MIRAAMAVSQFRSKSALNVTYMYRNSVQNT